MNNIKPIILALTVSVLLYTCSPAGGEHTGSEYMPDMGHSLAMEANTYNYYYHNTWDEASTIELKELVRDPALPVPGTIARGYAGGSGLHGEHPLSDMRIPMNGSVPYYYVDTEESRTQAMAEILDNPFPISADGLARGKELYDIFCGICHGTKGDGLGYIYDADQNTNAKYLAAPANLINEEFSAASNGRFYHAIMFGKNVMGSYADKISYEERWQVIHYIRSLQAKAAGATYNEEENTFNAGFGIPAASFPTDTVQTAMTLEEHMHETDDHQMTNGEHQTDDHSH